ncbi:hypothetical protein CPC08DRAFT_823128 [Agrocybe pediades]|nr:hypothetical protein CPC08DRAFT_823128 [Agrocybe pediades]
MPPLTSGTLSHASSEGCSPQPWIESEPGEPDDSMMGDASAHPSPGVSDFDLQLRDNSSSPHHLSEIESELGERDRPILTGTLRADPGLDGQSLSVNGSSHGLSPPFVLASPRDPESNSLHAQPTSPERRPPMIKGSGSSPAVYTVQGGSGRKPLKGNPKIFLEMAEELKGRWIGPMPVADFLDDFLSTDYITAARPEQSVNWKTAFKGMKRHRIERLMYEDIIKRVENSNALMSTMKIVQTADNSDRNSNPDKKNKPDLGIYPFSMKKSDGPTQFDIMVSAFEVKNARKDRKSSIDPFSDDGKADAADFAFEPDAVERKESRGQLATYARMVLNRQHLTHFFMVFIGHPFARLIRFDRDGAVVSSSFNYLQQGQLLCEFLWRLSNINEEMRGLDPSATLATTEEATLAKEKLAKWKPKDGIEQPVYKLTIPEAEDESQDKKAEQGPERISQLPTPASRTMKVLVWAPLEEPQCVVGRATRALPAYDPSSEQVVFVKDAWRYTDEGMTKETEIIQNINNNGVTDGVPVLLCGDDLEGVYQTTVTIEYAKRPWNIGGRPEASPKKHIRFATDKVGRPLTDFESSKEFLQAVNDAFKAHKSVYAKCKILHRDVSIHNILITEDGRGFLNDWDQARTVEDIQSGPRRSRRSATWLYMSVPLLQRPSKFHTLQDDIESFFWVILDVVIRYIPHNYTGHKGLQSDYNIIFKDHKRINGVRDEGGDGKISYLNRRVFDEPSLKSVDNEMLDNFLEKAADMLWRYHKVVDEIRNQVTETRPKVDNKERAVYEVILTDENVERCHLSSHHAMEALFSEALKAEGWPTGDASRDAFEVEKKSLGKRKARYYEEEDEDDDEEEDEDSDDEDEEDDEDEGDDDDEDDDDDPSEAERRTKRPKTSSARASGPHRARGRGIHTKASKGERKSARIAKMYLRNALDYE